VAPILLQNLDSHKDPHQLPSTLITILGHKNLCRTQKSFELRNTPCRFHLLSWSRSSISDPWFPIHLRWDDSKQKLAVIRVPAFAVLANDPHRTPLSHPPQHHFHVPLALQSVILHLQQHQNKLTNYTHGDCQKIMTQKITKQYYMLSRKSLFFLKLGSSRRVLL